jgi:hypothetical protein
MRKYLAYTFLLLAGFAYSPKLSAQFMFSQDSIDGFWSGVLTQNTGGYAAEYEFSLQLDQYKDFVSGVAKVSVNDIKSEINLTGRRLPNGSWRLEEDRINYSRQPDHLEWCLKTYEIRMSTSTSGKVMLIGPWWGFSKSASCIPGRIEVWRNGNRA